MGRIDVGGRVCERVGGRSDLDRTRRGGEDRVIGADGGGGDCNGGVGGGSGGGWRARAEAGRSSTVDVVLSETYLGSAVRLVAHGILLVACGIFLVARAPVWIVAVILVILADSRTVILALLSSCTYVRYSVVAVIRLQVLVLFFV